MSGRTKQPAAKATVSIAGVKWPVEAEFYGDASDRAAVLMASFEFFGASFYLQCVAYEEDEAGERRLSQGVPMAIAERFHHLRGLATGDVEGELNTCEIDGRRYVMWVEPGGE
ncbi:MAG: hypothetical protein IBJ15_00280 [Alphaproteobacteria bacterium]|nr:hypothetical protein [Alphaproteobacteria bacterium]